MSTRKYGTLCCRIASILLLNLFVIKPAFGQALSLSEIKAGFVYQFLAFTELPESVYDSEDQALTIGILGDREFRKLFLPIEGRKVQGRRVEVKYLPRNTATEQLASFHLLFLPALLDKEIQPILSQLKNHPVLTVSDYDGFVEKGGMIALLAKGDRLGFEINQAAAHRVGIGFRSKLLRLASNVVGDDDEH